MTSSADVRNQLQALLERDLVGPWGGEIEVLTSSPRNRYLVGLLAPVVIDPSVAALDPSFAANSDDPDESALIDPQADAPPGVPAGIDEDLDSGDSRDDSDDRQISGSLTWPSSMGLRCQVPVDTVTLAVTTRWGRYSTQSGGNADGKKITERPREQIDIHTVVSLKPSQYDLRDGDARLSVEVFEEPDRRIVELALINCQHTGTNAPPENWMFQTEIIAQAHDGSAIFLPTRDPLTVDSAEPDPELQHLELLYRDRLEYAIGRTCSVTVTEDVEARKATEVRTTWLPTAEIAQTVAAGADATLLDMKLLADANEMEIEAGLLPLIDGYDAWLETQRSRVASLPESLRITAESAIEVAEWTAGRLRSGLNLLIGDSDASIQARQSFAFMNRTMRDQRIRSQVAQKRAADPELGVKDAIALVEATGSIAASWRPFQLAFILIQLPALIDPTDKNRSSSAACAELLFFPTGGGKTEAYLGLAAFTFAVRRLQGVVESAEGNLDGGDGVAVLMRYTLRLLTSQQFLRATTLVCAAEIERRKDPEIWGSEPFRIGLWVGSSVSPKRFEEAKKQVGDARSDDSKTYGLTVLQVKRCPWCGSVIDPKRDLAADSDTRRIYVRCGDALGGCPFAAGEGLPILTVDEEIYRHPPTFLLATVDKFARLAREGQAASLFGYVRERCPRHGYRHVDSNQSVCGKASSHQAKQVGGRTLPATSVKPIDRLRPPDLIIQDELHLISGALGTAVGLFENAIDILCSWETDDGEPVRPLIVASTATVRNAKNQVKGLYGRSVSVFPPQVLDVTDTYFSREVPVDEENPGRRYLGVCAHGVRLTLAEIRLAEVLLFAGQKLFDENGDAADPYMTLVGYFNATRELAGMRRFIDDDVTTRVSARNDPRGFPRRTSTDLAVGELTARISSGDISKTLDQLGAPFDPNTSTTAARMKWAAEAKRRRDAGKKPPKLLSSTGRPYDVVLATSMLQVGVDVPRLGLMLIVGQPKNTAEYIQASSRVGRTATKPGLVVTLANWARPRDMAHFEQFEYYHDTFYAQVEALSVTPYSDAALERGLTGLLVSAARVLDAAADGSSLSPKRGARNVDDRRQVLNALVDKIAERAGNSDQRDSTKQEVRGRLTFRVDKWSDLAGKETLAYDPVSDKTEHIGTLLVSPEVTAEAGEKRLFRVANSMREVQPELNLLVPPKNPAGGQASNEPNWSFPGGRADADGSAND